MGFCKSQLITLLLVFVCISTSVITEAFECPSDGNHPNPKDCASFYICSNGNPTLFHCLKPLLYNQKISVCDLPENVECTVEPGPSTPPMEEKFSCVGRPNGLYPNPIDCRTFYKCSNETTYMYECPPPLYFHPELLICLMQHEVPYCGRNSTTPNPPTEVPTMSTQNPDEFTCDDKPYGNYAHPSNCTLFYRCTEGGKQLLQCPGPLVFNPVIQMCDWEENVPSCRKQTTAPSTTTTPGPEPTTIDSGEFTCNGRPDGLYPNPEDCATFYKCSRGIAYLYDCPGDLLFDRIFLYCDIPEHARCG